MRKVGRYLCGLALLVVVSGDLTAEPEPVTGKEPQVSELKEAAERYWAALAQQDWQTAYELEAQTHSDTPASPIQYFKARQTFPRHTKASVEKVELDGTDGTALVSTTFLLPVGPKALPLPRLYTSHWRWNGEQWLHVKSEWGEQ